MAKKSKKIEKETRRLIESITDLVKKKGDRYKFKVKNKKTIKKVKKTCCHWIYRKNKEVPTLNASIDRKGYWRCDICEAEFPVVPYTLKEYEEIYNTALETVNQIQFWAVRLGGDADDTKMFLRLKSDLPRMIKVAKNILKAIEKRRLSESKNNSKEVLSQFSNYSGFNYRTV